MNWNNWSANAIRKEAGTKMLSSWRLARLPPSCAVLWRSSSPRVGASRTHEWSECAAWFLAYSLSWKERPTLSSWAAWPILCLSSVFPLVCWWCDYWALGFVYLDLGPSPAWALARRTSCPPLRAGTGCQYQYAQPLSNLRRHRESPPLLEGMRGKVTHPLKKM